MSLRFSRRAPLALLTALAIAAGSGAALADTQTVTIRIEAGQMVEIGTDTPSVKSEYSWILTRDHTFQSAQRTRFFQTRPVQPGAYVLDVSVQDPVASQNLYRAFQITVTEPSGILAPVPAGSGALRAMLVTDPPAFSGSAYITLEGGMLTMIGSQSTGNISSYSMDLDSTVDTDANGNFSDDRDNQGTFSEKSGSPLLYFFDPKAQQRSITLTVRDAQTGQTDTASLRIVFAAPPLGAIPQNAQSGLISMDGQNRTVHFTANVPENQTAGKQLLYEWSFGDGFRSLLNSPTHVYAVAGTYQIGLTVRDMATGQAVTTSASSVQVLGDPVGTSSSASSASSVSGSSGSGSLASSLNIGSIVQVGFIILMLLALAIGLYLLFTWIKRRTTGGLEKTIEHLEKSIVQKSGTPQLEAKVEPLKLKKESTKAADVPAATVIAEKEKSKTEFTSQTRSSNAPTTSSAPVPSWLAKASTTPAATPPPAATPAPKPAPTPPPAPASAPVPDWLKPPAAAPKPAPATPAPAPAPVAPPPAPPPAAQKPTEPKEMPIPKAEPKPVEPVKPAAPKKE